MHLEANFIVTIDDMIEFNLHALGKNQANIWLYRILWLIVPGFLFFFGIRLFLEDRGLLIGVAQVAFGLLWAFLFWPMIAIFNRWYTRMVVTERTMKATIGPTTIVLDEERVLVRKERYDFSTQWKYVNHVEETQGILYLYLSEMIAVVIPRYRFDRPEEYQAVRDFAFRRVSQEKSASPGTTSTQLRKA